MQRRELLEQLKALRNNQADEGESFHRRRDSAFEAKDAEFLPVALLQQADVVPQGSLDIAPYDACGDDVAAREGVDTHLVADEVVDGLIPSLSASIAVRSLMVTLLRPEYSFSIVLWKTVPSMAASRLSLTGSSATSRFTDP